VRLSLTCVVRSGDCAISLAARSGGRNACAATDLGSNRSEEGTVKQSRYLLLNDVNTGDTTRLYREERLMARRRGGRKRAVGTRANDLFAATE